MMTVCARKGGWGAIGQFLVVRKGKKGVVHDTAYTPVARKGFTIVEYLARYKSLTCEDVGRGWLWHCQHRR